MNYDAEFCRQFRKSEEEKSDCLVLINKILDLANSARNYGLLSLGKEAEEHTTFLLRKGLQLALDGVNSRTARTILEFYIFPADSKGKDLLESCIILEGIIGILDGMHPKLMKELLLSFLGETGHALYKGEYKDRENEKVSEYLKSVDKKAAASGSAAGLGDLIEPLDDVVIKQLLKNMNIDDLSMVIADLAGDAQLKLFSQLPERGAFLLVDAVEQQNSTPEHEIREAREKVVAIIGELKDLGLFN